MKIPRPDRPWAGTYDPFAVEQQVPEPAEERPWWWKHSGCVRCDGYTIYHRRIFNGQYLPIHWACYQAWDYQIPIHAGSLP